jgi:hypothetical protein
MRCVIPILLAVATWNLGTLAFATPETAEPPQSPLLSRPVDGGISEDIYSELVLFTKYSSAIYQFICPRPLGNKLVKSVRSSLFPALQALLTTERNTVRERSYARAWARRAG